MSNRPTSSPSLSDRVRESAVRICESGPAALAALYDLTSQRLVRYSLSITHHQHDAEDAVQAALLRVADRPRPLAWSEHPWPYLVRMVRNESLLILRRRGRTSSADLSDLVTRISVDEAEWEETYRAVWRGIRSLPVEQGEVVVLKIWESMTLAEIYHERAAMRSHAGSSLIGAVMIIAVAFLIGFTYIALMMPLFQLISGLS